MEMFKEMEHYLKKKSTTYIIPKPKLLLIDSNIDQICVIQINGNSTSSMEKKRTKLHQHYYYLLCN